MAALLLVAFALLAGTTCSALRAETTINAHPSVVQVEFLSVFSGLWSQSCAGSILTSWHLVSSANCFSGVLYSPAYRRIRAGATYRNTGGVVVPVLRENNHPSFGNHGLDGDISVVRLAEQLTFSPVVQQAPIIYQGAEFPDSIPLIHVGWGTTTQSNYQSDVLLEVILYKHDRDQCAHSYQGLAVPETVTENMICASLTSWDESFCRSDFGGPVTYRDIVMGVMSFGYDCVNNTFPAVATNVASYTNWIIETATY